MTPADLALEKGLARDYPVFFNALKHHRTHKGRRLDFASNPWAKDIYLDTHPHQVFIKSTQNGITEYLICREISEASRGRNVFHVLPNDQILQRYVHERFDKTSQLTPAYKQMIKGGTDSVHMKQVQSGTIAYVASGSASQFTEFAADSIIIDESDRCDQDNLVMAKERLSYSESPMQLWVSNPTLEGSGIDEMFAASDMHHWHIKCECGAVTHPDFFKHVVREVDKGDFMVIDRDWEPGRDATMICDKCQRPWSKSQAGIWIPFAPNALTRGRHLSKLFTARTTIGELIQNFTNAEANDTKMTRFWNADLGLAYTAPGAKITGDMLDACVTEWRQGFRPKDGICVAGIDVGTYFHVVIGWIQHGVAGIQVIDVQAVRDPEEVTALLAKYHVRCYVIDANPETRVSRQVANTRAGGFLCRFVHGWADKLTGNIIQTDRTQSLDNVKAAVMTQALRLPVNARSIQDFYAHMTASTRVFDEDGNGGEGAYNWVEGSKADHYFLATDYMFMAGRLLVMASK